ERRRATERVDLAPDELSLQVGGVLGPQLAGELLDPDRDGFELLVERAVVVGRGLHLRVQAAVAAVGGAHAGDAAPPELVAPVAPEGAVPGAVGGELDLLRVESVDGAVTGLVLAADHGGQRTFGVGELPPQI